MDHLAIPVRDPERSRRFYESYCGFGAKPARTYDDGVLMLYTADGFALAPSRRSRLWSIKFRDPDGYIIEASWEPS